MRRLFITIVFSFMLCYAYSQHLTYSTFMELSNTASVSRISSILRGYGYEYSDSFKWYSEADSTDITTVLWTNNCSFDIKTGRYTLNNNEICSAYRHHSEERCPWVINCDYMITSSVDFESFKKNAEEDGFCYFDDVIGENRIGMVFYRVDKEEELIERLTFTEYSKMPYFLISLYTAPYIIENPN